MSTTTLPAPTNAQAARHAAVTTPRPTSFLEDTITVAVRELRPLIREPFTLVFGMIQPLFFLGLFGPLLVRTSGLGESATLQWFVPGIIVMSVLFGVSGAALFLGEPFGWRRVAGAAAIATGVVLLSVA